MKIAGYFFIGQVLIGNHSINIKNLNMKKFFFVLAMGAFAACNNSSSTEKTADTTTKTTDTTKVVTDTTKHDSTGVAKPDTTKKDTTKTK